MAKPMVRAKAQVRQAADQCSAQGSAAKAAFMASVTARVRVRAIRSNPSLFF